MPSDINRKPTGNVRGGDRPGPGNGPRPPSDKPDVFLDVPELHVGEIYLDVEDLDAHLSLQARLANLVQVVAGVHVHIGKVELDIKDVDAQALLKVRLDNLYEILNRALTTIDRNPQILDGLISTVDDAASGIGETTRQAVQPGGAVAELAGDVGEVGEVGKQAVGPEGAVSESASAVGQAAEGVGHAAEMVGDDVAETVDEAGQGVRETAGRAAGDRHAARQGPRRQGHADVRGLRSRREKSGSSRRARD